MDGHEALGKAGQSAQLALARHWRLCVLSAGCIRPLRSSLARDTVNHGVPGQPAQHRGLQHLATSHTAAPAGLASWRPSAGARCRFVTFEDDSAVDQVFGGGPMHEISGKKVEVKAATPRGSGPQGMGPQPPGPFLRPMPAAGLPSRFSGLQGQLGQQVGSTLGSRKPAAAAPQL